MLFSPASHTPGLDPKLSARVWRAGRPRSYIAAATSFSPHTPLQNAPRLAKSAVAVKHYPSTEPMRGRGMNHFNTAMFLTLAAMLFAADALAAADKKKVLVYTRNHVTNGKGYVHENIPYSVEAIKKIGGESGFDVDHSEDPKVFTPQNLKQYSAIVFSNSNNEAFETQAQRDAFRRYIRGGGGFVGIHS